MAQMIDRSAVGTTSAPAKKDSIGVSSVSRVSVFLHSLAFVLGFSVIFTLLGVVAGAIGLTISDWLQRVGAVLLLFLALTTMGVFRWLVEKLQEVSGTKDNPALSPLINVLQFFNNLLYSEKRVVEIHNVDKRWGYLSSFIIGLSFGAGWTPCVGPILGSIWFLAGASETVGQATILMALYSLGLGIPFLIVGAAFSRASVFLRRMNKYSNAVGIVSGLLLIGIAYLLWTGQLATLAGQFQGLNELAYSLEEWVSLNLSADGSIIGASLIVSAPIAIVAGFLSFVSPCVLPLVPAYIGYLSGASLSN